MTTQNASTQTPPLPPQLMLYQIGIGHYLSRALYVAAKLKIADLLRDGPLNHKEIASRTGTHAPSLNRVMRLLASIGVFSEEPGGKFALTELSQCLRTDLPGSMRASVMLFTGIGIQDAWKELEFCVQTGQPAFKRTSPNGDPFTRIQLDPEQAAIFDEAMAAFTAQTAIAVAAAYDFSRCRKVVDVGGGSGALLIGILKAVPALRGIVFDLPHGTERARRSIADAGLESRLEAVGGDFFKEVPAGADTYLIKHVIHDWDDEHALDILRNCRRAMNPQSKLVIVEGIYPERIVQSLECRGAAANDVNMLVSTGGRQRSESEFRALYEDAGFKLSKIIPTPARVALIEGEPV